MSEKPEFWDFYKALWKIRTNFDEFIEVREKKTGNIRRFEYSTGMKVIMIVFSISAAIVPSIINFLIFKRNECINLIFDNYLLFFLIAVLFNIILCRLLYTFRNFKEVTEDEWYASQQSRRKHQKAFLIVMYSLSIIAVMFALLNTYSITFLRYLSEGKGRTGSAIIELHISERETELSESEAKIVIIPSIKGEEEIGLYIDLIRVPSADYILNGKQLMPDFIFWEPSYFWEDEYFVSKSYISLQLSDLKENNIIEIKNGNFHKVWTFSVKQE